MELSLVKKIYRLVIMNSDCNIFIVGCVCHSIYNTVIFNTSLNPKYSFKRLFKFNIVYIQDIVFNIFKTKRKKLTHWFDRR